MLRAAVSAEDMGQRALAAGRSDFFLKKKRMLRAAVSAEDMGQRALAAGLLLHMVVTLCVSSPAIEAIFFFLKKAYIFVCSAVLLLYVCVLLLYVLYVCAAVCVFCMCVLLLYVCVLMLLCAARGGVGGGVFKASYTSSLRPEVCLRPHTLVA
jgi:hypothetical protein